VSDRSATTGRPTAAGRGVSSRPPIDWPATGRSMNVRAVAALALGLVLGEGRSLAIALPAALERVDSRDRGLLQELCYGACRWYLQLQVMLDRLLTRPLSAAEPTVHALLLIGRPRAAAHWSLSIVVLANSRARRSRRDRCRRASVAKIVGVRADQRCAAIRNASAGGIDSGFGK